MLAKEAAILTMIHLNELTAILAQIKSAAINKKFSLNLPRLTNGQVNCLSNMGYKVTTHSDLKHGTTIVWES